MGDIAHQLGLAEEATWGTIQTPTRFYEFVNETLHRENIYAQSEAIRSGRRLRGQGRRIARQTANGSITFEVGRVGFGVFFKHLLGGVSSVNTVGTVWTHTFTPGTLLGKGLTLQKGVQKSDGTVQAFTYEGTKIVAAEFSVSQDGLLMMTADFDAQAETTATALASASYVDPVPFTYSEGVLKKDGVTVASVRSVPSVRLQNHLLTERMFMGNAGLKEQQINVPFDEISGSLDVEFQNLTDFYNAFAADTELTIVLVFTGAIIEGAHNYTFQLTINNARIEGETPQISGPELVYQSVPFVGLDDLSVADVEIVYKTTGATP
jgi:hypothetical protein